MKKKYYWVVGIIVFIIVSLASLDVYTKCSWTSRCGGSKCIDSLESLYPECKSWKESGYLGEKFPTSIHPTINEGTSKEEIISQVKIRCEDILSNYGICETIGLWK